MTTTQVKSFFMMGKAIKLVLEDDYSENKRLEKTKYDKRNRL